MALAARISTIEIKPRFERWIDALSDSNRAVVLGWLHDPNVPNRTIAGAIRRDDPEDDFAGYPASADTIATWRRTHAAL